MRTSGEDMAGADGMNASFMTLSPKNAACTSLVPSSNLVTDANCAAVSRGACTQRSNGAVSLQGQCRGLRNPKRHLEAATRKQTQGSSKIGS